MKKEKNTFEERMDLFFDHKPKFVLLSIDNESITICFEVKIFNLKTSSYSALVN